MRRLLSFELIRPLLPVWESTMQYTSKSFEDSTNQISDDDPFLGMLDNVTVSSSSTASPSATVKPSKKPPNEATAKVDGNTAPHDARRKAVKKIRRQLRSYAIREQKDRYEQRKAEWAEFKTNKKVRGDQKQEDFYSVPADLHETLPTNEALETSISYNILSHKDPRADLDFTHKLLKSTLISMASPVGWWDPYDVKPQAFAFDQYAALPVFTSLAYLQNFCHQNKYTVRDPSGTLWADGTNILHDPPKLEPPMPSEESPIEPNTASVLGEAKAEEVKPSIVQKPLVIDRVAARKFEDVISEGNSAVDADTFFDFMSGESSELNTTEAVRKSTAETKDARKSRMRREREALKKARLEAASLRNKKVEAHKQRLWSALERMPRTLKKGTIVTPLITYGPFIRPYFVGYYADVRTLMHNASIVPRMVDIIINPCSPLEIIVSRSAATQALSNDMLLRQAYSRVERQLRAEFHNFFLNFCAKGEVLKAKSYCLAQAAPESTPDEDALYDIVIIVECSDFTRLVNRLKDAKQRGIIKGHSSLSLVPFHAAPPFMLEGSTLFYEAEASDNPSAAYRPVDYYADEKVQNMITNSASNTPSSNGSSSPSTFAKAPRTVGVFKQLGQQATISIRHSADSIYADPTNQSTEAAGVAAQRFRLGVETM